MMTFEQWRNTRTQVTLKTDPDRFIGICEDNNWDADQVTAVHQYAGGLHFIEEPLRFDLTTKEVSDDGTTLKSHDLQRGTNVYHLIIERREWLVEAKEENREELERALYEWGKVECSTAMAAPEVKLPDLIDKLANEAMPLIEFYLVECSEEKDAGLKDVVQTLEHALGFLQDLAALHDGSIDFRQ